MHVQRQLSSLVGGMQAQVDGIERNTIDPECFSDVERAAMRFTEEVVNRVKADEATVRELMKFLSAREIVELILAIGFYMTMARLTETTRTDLDPPAATQRGDGLARAR